MLEDMDQKDIMIFQCMYVINNSNDFLNSREMKKGRGIFVDVTFGARNMLATMQATMTLFKSLTNCILWNLMSWLFFEVLIIKYHVQFACEFPMSYL
jgi:hypothetical protein